MKTIGILGGMSWESTATYYQLLNRMVRSRLGGLHSADILLRSFDFAPIARLQSNGDWDGAAELMTKAALALEKAGADCLLIGTNTMHICADPVQSRLSIPLLHIADVTAEAVKDRGCRSPLLLATRFTMERDFYKGRLSLKHGVEVVIPDEQQRADVHRIIYDELCQGLISSQSKALYLQIIEAAKTRGADGVIFGCTEVGLLISADDVDVPVFNSTELHAQAAVDFALTDQI
ncbi:aspartate racemase [Hoeflea halophila]|uniref:Aspartate racemase n=1 Tax=Hoeflea halophila TaxID=714899 RepID=A0A286IBH2_9HYPH|nr:aspartate/glutamate racemase family protein [Hoeflea halophila]SOE17422.1 aspartate racemase [Hoeflea halophila]